VAESASCFAINPYKRALYAQLQTWDQHFRERVQAVRTVVTSRTRLASILPLSTSNVPSIEDSSAPVHSVAVVPLTTTPLTSPSPSATGSPRSRTNSSGQQLSVAVQVAKRLSGHLQSTARGALSADECGVAAAAAGESVGQRRRSSSLRAAEDELTLPLSDGEQQHEEAVERDEVAADEGREPAGCDELNTESSSSSAGTTITITRATSATGQSVTSALLDGDAQPTNGRSSREPTKQLADAEPDTTAASTPSAVSSSATTSVTSAASTIATVNSTSASTASMASTTSAASSTSTVSSTPTPPDALPPAGEAEARKRRRPRKYPKPPAAVAAIMSGEFSAELHHLLLELPGVLLPSIEGGAHIGVHGHEPSSIVAYTLCSDQYQNKLTKAMDDRIPPGTFARVALDSKLHGDESAEVEQLLSITRAPKEHLVCKYAHGADLDRVRFSCKVYHAYGFEVLRRVCCGPDPMQFVESMARCHFWNATGGKSGSLFLKTADDRYILKQVSKVELLSFLELAPLYFSYMSRAVSCGIPTMLAKVVGVYTLEYRMENRSTLKNTVLVMENLFYNRNVSLVYDLKGSVRSRYVVDPDANQVLMDENLLEQYFDAPVPVE
jgi:Phosphatidylinositol-4-phosphate 5-Kinase